MKQRKQLQTVLLFVINIVGIILLTCHDINNSLVLQCNISVVSNFIIINLWYFFTSMKQKSMKRSQQKLNNHTEYKNKIQETAVYLMVI